MEARKAFLAGGDQIISRRQKIAKCRGLKVAVCLLALAGAGLASLAGRSAAQTQSMFRIPPGELMLVRSWNPGTGELIGWMPMNRVAITLGLLPGQKHLPSFEMNSAVTVHFPYRPSAAVKYGRLPVARKTVTEDGHEYALVPIAANLVRIYKLEFYVKSIDFGDSKWRQPTAVDVAKPRRRGNNASP
jgi:hypothetical protein